MRGFVISVGNERTPSRSERWVAFIIRWLITAVAVWVAAAIVPGIHLEGAGSTMLVALILGLLNAYLKPLLVLGALPALVMTLGLFLVLINTALLALTAWIAGKFDAIKFDIDGFWAALWGAVMISLVSFLLTRFFRPERIAREMTRP
jgi:putative membrane protein